MIIPIPTHCPKGCPLIINKGATYSYFRCAPLKDNFAIKKLTINHFYLDVLPIDNENVNFHSFFASNSSNSKAIFISDAPDYQITKIYTSNMGIWTVPVAWYVNYAIKLQPNQIDIDNAINTLLTFQ